MIGDEAKSRYTMSMKSDWEKFNEKRKKNDIKSNGKK